jgi:hypothetical protein
MPYPKISPALNNCPFYVLTPELKEEIAKYAADEAHDNGHNAQYTLLKQHFGAHYGIDQLSWKDFSGILKNYNAFDVQILLGPVLRNFSKEMMEKGDQEELMLMALGNDKYSIEDYIKATTEINAGNGRYDSLNPDHLFKYAAAPLGLSVTYNKTGNPSQSFDTDRPVAAVSIHHHGNIEGAQAGGHWERVQNRDDAVDYEKAVDTQLTPLLPLLGDNATLNSFGLDLLKKHVQLMHRHEKDNFDMTKSVEEMMLTSAQIQRYMWNINYLPKPLAVKLLGEPLTQETTNLIRDMGIGHIDREPIIQRYFEAPIGNKPHVAQDARAIITKLEQDIIVPKVFIPPVNIEVVNAHSTPCYSDREQDDLASDEQVEPTQIKETSPHQLLAVDNSGAGNCMYYAYSISLMYYLLNKRDRAIADSVFNKLDLSVREKQLLNNLLEDTSISQFNTRQIKTIIEPILGRATRTVGANQTVEAFLLNPEKSPIFAATNHGMEYLISKRMKQSRYFPHNSAPFSSTFDDPAFTEAEIFKLFPITGTALNGFANSAYEAIMQQFETGWPERKIKIFSDTRGNPRPPTREEIEASTFYKEIYLSELIKKKTIEFFTNDNNTRLNQYRDRLNTDLIWGEAETLNMLHSYVQGERMVPNEGVCVQDRYVQDLPIPLHINSNIIPNTVAQPNEGIIVRNIDNLHWISEVRPAVVTPIHEVVSTQLATSYEQQHIKSKEPIAPLVETTVIEPKIAPVEAETKNDSNNYNFLLNAVITLSATLSLATLIVASLALAAVITIPTAGIGAVLTVGAVAGLMGYGLFNNKNQSNKPDPELTDAHLNTPGETGAKI